MAKLCALCVYPFPVAITHLLFFKKPSVNINMYLHMCSTWALSNDYAINPLNPECVSVFFFSRCSMMCLCCSVMWLDLHTFVHLLAPWKWWPCWTICTLCLTRSVSSIMSTKWVITYGWQQASWFCIKLGNVQISFHRNSVT